MPKLSQYVHQKSSETQKAPTQPSNYASQIKSDQQAATEPDHAPDGTSELELPPSQIEASLERLQIAYNRRLKEHGPRLFRWPDGSLKPNKPPPNPYSVANRERWSDLVHHCRTHAGDRVYESTKRSLRYGINVPYNSHVKYLNSIGLEPETDERGEYIGLDASLSRPLKDPAHALNSYYKQEADRISTQQRGHLL